MTQERKKMIEAFKLYYSNSKDMNEYRSTPDIQAVKSCLCMFKHIKDGAEILQAVEAVYIRDSGGTVSSRVRRFATDTYVSERTVYGYLRKATDFYTKELKLLS